jgi:hypothetical protein
MYVVVNDMQYLLENQFFLRTCWLKEHFADVNISVVVLLAGGLNNITIVLNIN